MFESAGPDEYIDCLSFVDGVDLVLSHGQDVHYAKHSCDPNLWHADAFTLVARRPISADEEVVVDYATHSDDPNFSFICRCGSPQCRGVVSGIDWQRADLQERYGDHWVPGLLDKIRAEVT